MEELGLWVKLVCVMGPDAALASVKGPAALLAAHGADGEAHLL